MSRYKQWTTCDGKGYFPAGDVVTQLPPGYYAIKNSMQGTYFEKKTTKSEKLMRFTDATSDLVIEEIEAFWDLEEKFRESDIPYKRGMILYGPPGSGKTCTLRIAIENLTKRGGIVIDFGDTYMFKEGYEILRDIHDDMPLIVLMEDLDAILRRNSESEVMNVLDGVYDIDRTVFLATTNYPEQLGSRIMNRPSRFDKKIFIGMPSEEAREQYIRSKLIDEDDATVKQWVKDTNGMSIAHLKELYVANKILGDSYEQAIKTLKSMKITTGSSTFDDYAVEDKEAYWDKWGQGEVYSEAKKRYKVISESGMPSRSEIADMISEDLS